MAFSLSGICYITSYTLCSVSYGCQKSFCVSLGLRQLGSLIYSLPKMPQKSLVQMTEKPP